MQDLAARRTQLEERWDTLSKRINRLEQSLARPTDRNWDEAAVERENDEVKEELGLESVEESKAILAALARIEDGSYGYCTSCGGKISPERLDIIPYTPKCADCAA